MFNFNCPTCLTNFDSTVKKTMPYTRKLHYPNAESHIGHNFLRALTSLMAFVEKNWNMQIYKLNFQNEIENCMSMSIYFLLILTSVISFFETVTEKLHLLAQDPVRGLCFYARSGQGWIQGQSKCGSDGTPPNCCIDWKTKSIRVIDKDMIWICIFIELSFLHIFLDLLF